MNKILLFVLLVAFAATGYAGYMGVFSSMKVTEKVMGPYTLVYEEFTGPYKDSGPVFERVYNNLKSDGIETVNGLGIYLDNPQYVPQEKLRSELGSVVEQADLPRLQNIKGKYRIKNLPGSKALVVEFPIRGNLSYMIGPIKAYPALTEYAQTKGVVMRQPYELYDMKKRTIYFVMPVE